MYYGIIQENIRSNKFKIIEGENPTYLFQMGCTGVFINKSDAEWIVEQLNS